MSEENAKTVVIFKTRCSLKRIQITVGVVVLIIIGVLSYNYTALKTKCEKQVNFIPAVGEEKNGRFGHPAQDAYFSWGNSKYETREEAVKGCVRYK